MNHLNERTRLMVQTGWLSNAHDILLQVMDSAAAAGEPRETIEQARSAVLRALEASESELYVLQRHGGAAS